MGYVQPYKSHRQTTYPNIKYIMLSRVVECKNIENVPTRGGER